MKAILYYFALPWIYLISILPFWLLYRVSDFLFVVLYYVLGYRKKVIYPNLRNAFPEKSENEIRVIAKKFYRYFCDLILETIKSITISPSALRKRVTFDPEALALLKKFYQRDQSLVAVLGHWGNWELGGARFALEPLHTLAIIYHPLKNEYFESLVVHMRTRLGNRLYPMKETYRRIISDRSEITATAFIADQTPSNPAGAYWMEFLNQDTPVFLGPERVARKHKYPCIYISVNQPRRGYYYITAELLAEFPEKLQENELTRLHTKKLEEDIKKQPEIWLWGHRRWKHSRKSPD
ncbi:MAG: lipid A biosynthesis acyltransferase [Saprospiraceae bacterium]|nr:lipid A biosynthesis acyltransferase [Saprospiraceae bacterium]